MKKSKGKIEGEREDCGAFWRKAEILQVVLGYIGSQSSVRIGTGLSFSETPLESPDT